MEMTFQYLIKVAIVNQDNGKATLQQATINLENPFDTFQDLVIAFFQQWDHPDKFSGKFVIGVLNVELL